VADEHQGQLFIKKSFLEKTLPAGFQIGKKDRATSTPPESVTTELGLATLEAAIERLKNELGRTAHPVLGYLTSKEWTKFHLRHTDMYISFERPA